MIRSIEKNRWGKIRHRVSQLLLTGEQTADEYATLSSKNPQMRQAIATIHKLESYKTPCLIIGEEGTGKRFWARFIHQRSYFRNGPFVVLNTNTLSSPSPENTIFVQETIFKDKLEQAQGGTLYITEITCLSPSLQNELLKVIRKQHPGLKTGDPNSNRIPPLRIIAGTQKDLQQEVARGQFQPLLYYRLTVFPVYLPPLRQRREDILPLATHFMEIFAKHLGKTVKTMSTQFQAFLLQHLWPGNLDELRDLMLLSVYFTPPHMEELILPWFQTGAVDIREHNYYEVKEKTKDLLVAT